MENRNSPLAIVFAIYISTTAILLLQVLQLNKEIYAGGLEMQIETNKYVDCQNTLEGTQMDVERLTQTN